MRYAHRNITFRGETKSLSEWSKALGIGMMALSIRNRLGVPLDEPLRIQRKKSAPPVASTRATKHPLYKTWNLMRARCQNPGDDRWVSYGGRGIKVCDAWRNDFWQFVKDMGERPPGHTIDRIDNDGDYTPENCRWATRSQQERNKVYNNRATWNGETLTVADWAERFGVSYHQMWARVRWYRGDMSKVVPSIQKLQSQRF